MYQTKKPEFIGDKEEATYRWELYLLNGKIFDGYSKRAGHAEKQDKEALFQDCIARLGENGYFQKCYQMVFYKREFMHKSQDTKLLECYPYHYIASDALNFQLPTLSYLDRIYERLTQKNGAAPIDAKDFKALLPQRAAFRSQEKDDFEFTKTKFPTIEHMVAHCAEYLLREKHYPRTRVEAWYHKVKHNYSGQPLPVSSPTVRPASVDVPPAQAPMQTPSMPKVAEAAKQQISNIHARFTANR